jgi:hypothetical protein
MYLLNFFKTIGLQQKEIEPDRCYYYSFLSLLNSIVVNLVRVRGYLLEAVSLRKQYRANESGCKCWKSAKAEVCHLSLHWEVLIATIDQAFFSMLS